MHFLDLGNMLKIKDLVTDQHRMVEIGIRFKGWKYLKSCQPFPR